LREHDWLLKSSRIASPVDEHFDSSERG